VKPGNKMIIPGGQLDADEITALIAYLNTLR
jgi:cytochrome c2